MNSDLSDADAPLESPDVKTAPDVKAAWSKEIARRVQEIDDGVVELLDWENVRAELME